MSKKVTEKDFRLPEFKDAKVEDYERRGDGSIVRKDRWRTGIWAIATNLGLRDWEISDVIAEVVKLKSINEGRKKDGSSK